MIWLRLVDPECPTIPRPHFNNVDPETTELDTRHIHMCPRCMDWLMMQKEIDEPGT